MFLFNKAKYLLCDNSKIFFIFSQFVKQNGPDIIMDKFYEALEKGDERLVHRCVVMITNIGASAAPQLIQALQVDVNKYIKLIEDALKLHGDKYTESLSYLES